MMRCYRYGDSIVIAIMLLFMRIVCGDTASGIDFSFNNCRTRKAHDDYYDYTHKCCGALCVALCDVVDDDE